MILTMLVNRTQAYGHVTKLPRASDSFSRLHAGIGIGSEKSSNPFTIVSTATLMWPLVTALNALFGPLYLAGPHHMKPQLSRHH